MRQKTGWKALKIEAFMTVIIVGIHDGVHIRNILEKVEPNTNILIYEPSVEVFLKALEEVDLTFCLRIIYR